MLKRYKISGPKINLGVLYVHYDNEFIPFLIKYPISRNIMDDGEIYNNYRCKNFEI